MSEKEKERLAQSKRGGSPHSYPNPVSKTQRSDQPHERGLSSAMAAIRDVSDTQLEEDVPPVAHLGEVAAFQTRQERLAEKVQQSIASLAQVLAEALPQGRQIQPPAGIPAGQIANGPPMSDDRGVGSGAFTHPPSSPARVEDDMAIDRQQEERDKGENYNYFTPERIPRDLQRQLKEAQKKLKRNMSIVLNCKDRIQKTSMELEKLTKGETPNGNTPFKMVYICEEMDEKVGKNRKFEIQFSADMTHKQRLEKLYQGYLHERKSLEIELIKKRQVEMEKMCHFEKFEQEIVGIVTLKDQKELEELGLTLGPDILKNSEKSAKKMAALSFRDLIRTFKDERLKKHEEEEKSRMEKDKILQKAGTLDARQVIINTIRSVVGQGKGNKIDHLKQFEELIMTKKPGEPTLQENERGNKPEQGGKGSNSTRTRGQSKGKGKGKGKSKGRGSSSRGKGKGDTKGKGKGKQKGKGTGAQKGKQAKAKGKGQRQPKNGKGPQPETWKGGQQAQSGKSWGKAANTQKAAGKKGSKGKSYGASGKGWNANKGNNWNKRKGGKGWQPQW